MRDNKLNEIRQDYDAIALPKDLEDRGSARQRRNHREVFTRNLHSGQNSEVVQ